MNETSQVRLAEIIEAFHDPLATIQELQARVAMLLSQKDRWLERLKAKREHQVARKTETQMQHEGQIDRKILH